MQQILAIFSLLPAYLVFWAIFLVIIPTVIAIILRFSLYLYLAKLSRNIKKILLGVKLETYPKIINRLEQRFSETNNNRDGINTTAVIEGAYSQEKFNCLGLSLNCEFIDNLVRVLPNLLLSFGLLGTFLGITINLTNLSQTITQVDINDVRNLVEELDRPLQGMGIAFITSLIAIACSSLLTLINLLWNTKITKSTLLNTVEDYIDNIYLPKVLPNDPMAESIDRLNRDFDTMLHKLGKTIENSMNTAFARIEQSADTFDQAANTLEQSRFPEKLAAATNNLAIAQNQFSQSSLVLQKSTQSFEHSLDGMQQLTRKLVEMKDRVNDINQKYTTLININQRQNIIEESGLKDIQRELSKLINRMSQV